MSITVTCACGVVLVPAGTVPTPAALGIALRRHPHVAPYITFHCDRCGESFEAGPALHAILNDDNVKATSHDDARASSLWVKAHLQCGDADDLEAARMELELAMRAWLAASRERRHTAATNIIVTFALREAGEADDYRNELAALLDSVKAQVLAGHLQGPLVDRRERVVGAFRVEGL